MGIKDGASCPACGLPNYSGLCPVCRGDMEAYNDELRFAFGPWFPKDENPIAIERPKEGD